MACARSTGKSTAAGFFRSTVCWLAFGSAFGTVCIAPASYAAYVRPAPYYGSPASAPVYNVPPPAPVYHAPAPAAPVYNAPSYSAPAYQPAPYAPPQPAMLPTINVTDESATSTSGFDPTAPVASSTAPARRPVNAAAVPPPVSAPQMLIVPPSGSGGAYRRPQTIAPVASSFPAAQPVADPLQPAPLPYHTAAPVMAETYVPPPAAPLPVPAEQPLTGTNVYPQPQAEPAPAAPPLAQPMPVDVPLSPEPFAQTQPVNEELAAPPPHPGLQVSVIDATGTPGESEEAPSEDWVDPAEMTQDHPLPVDANGLPVGDAEAAAPLPPRELSDETKKILSMIPSGVDTNTAPRGPQAFKINRFDPELEGILNAPVTPPAEEGVEKSESSGVSIEVRRPTINADYELEKAYNALVSGQSEVAVQTYKRVLKQDPGNQAALFGLATTYHRLGDLDLARPFYGKLLSINPDHRDALNNFLVLVADESPEEALRYMEQLEDKNPDFSPIQAQMAILYQRLGNPTAAVDKMARAVSISPENLAYKYNLGVLLDQQGRYADAAEIYRQLLTSAQRGEPLPADVNSIQKRLRYLLSEYQLTVSTPPLAM